MGASADRRARERTGKVDIYIFPSGRMRQGGGFYKNPRQSGVVNKCHFTREAGSDFVRALFDFMKNRTKIRLVLTTATLGLLGPAAQAAERWATLQAIHWVENPNNQTRVGPHGELGPYQFRVATWRMHSSRPFAHAVQRQFADEVAVKHYEWITTGLRRAGIQPNPFHIALAWNGGLEAVVSGRAPAACFRYAEQVQNLVEKLQRQEKLPAARVAAPQLAPATPAPRFEISDDLSRFSVPLGGPRFVLATS